MIKKENGTRHKLTPSQENYLEWIYRFSQEGPVRARDLARKLGVRLPSVSRAVSGLTRAGLIRHESYGTIELTEEGARAGAEIVRRDDCLTRLLVEVLNMHPREADPEVHQMEHALGEEVLARLEVLIDFALSSDAWIKRLHHRIGSRAAAGGHAKSPYRVGAALLHAGLEREKASG
jgi:Mn-dependent DtxR family transcriptional regulator